MDHLTRVALGGRGHEALPQTAFVRWRLLAIQCLREALAEHLAKVKVERGPHLGWHTGDQFGRVGRGEEPHHVPRRRGRRIVLCDGHRGLEVERRVPPTARHKQQLALLHNSFARPVCRVGMAARCERRVEDAEPLVQRERRGNGRAVGGGSHPRRWRLGRAEQPLLPSPYKPVPGGGGVGVDVPQAARACATDDEPAIVRPALRRQLCEEVALGGEEGRHVVFGRHLWLPLGK
mmetsp:Transcript_3159/g.10671  ORF Transcript_3159/g.10671 Transcript_3159/m.10671 type:complete len:234 (+) Transcript_3159:373-1074(+)